jgi:hypothetical protein
MKINKSDLQKLTLAMENKNLSVAQVIKLVENSEAIESATNSTDSEIKLTVDYTKTVEQAITNGHYNFKNSDITAKNFPVSSEMIGKKMEVAVRLFHFNCSISSDDASLEMHKAGYRPATLMELLTLGSLFPEIQRQFPIIALGSVWRAACLDCYVPYLHVFNSRRRLNLYWFGIDWGAHCRFLGVRK